MYRKCSNNQPVHYEFWHHPLLANFISLEQLRTIKKLFLYIAIELVLSEDCDNVIDRGVDLAIRVGELQDSTIVALPIASSRLLVCGSPK